MLKNQNITLSDGRKVLVKELRIKDLLGVLQKFDNDDEVKAESGSSNAKQMIDLKDSLFELLPLVTDLPQAVLLELYPSDLEKLVDAFKEANKIFFDLARSIGLDAIAKDLLAGLQAELSASITEDLKGILPGLSVEGSPLEKSKSTASISTLPLSRNTPDAASN